MSNTTSPQGSNKVEKKEDRGLFLQLPFILIDTLKMNDSAMIGFLRFCRQFLQKDCTIEYHGSYRSLAEDISQARTTCYRSVEQWVKAGILQKEDTGDEFILTGNLTPYWSRNAEHCKAHQRPKSGQKKRKSSSASQIGTEENSTLSQNGTRSVPNRNTSIPNRDENGKKWDTSEHEIAPIDTIDTNVIDTKREKESGKTILTPNVSGFAVATPCILSFKNLDLGSLSGNLTETSAKFAYSQETTQQPAFEQNQEKMSELPDAGYRQTIDVNTSSERKEEKPSTPAREKGKRSKKEKVEQPSLPFERGIALDDDEQRISDWFCKFWFIKVPPLVNERYKKHCRTLVPFVHSWEEMQSLEKVARVYLQSQLKPGTKVGGLHLGNFTNPNVLNNWQPDTPNNVVAIDSKQRSEVDTFAHVPAFGGKTDEQLAADLVNDLEFLRAHGIAVGQAV